MSEEFPGYVNIVAGEGTFADAGHAEAGLHRRGFLALSGALGLSSALATGCRRPDLEIRPYSALPEDRASQVIPGRPTFYATCLPRAGGALPVLVESHEGRPTKIEGHPLHPASSGGTDHFAQADILDLYHPDRVLADRFPAVAYRGQARTWADFEAALPQLRPATGEGLAILTDQAPAPARDLIRPQVQARFPKAVWYRHEPFSDDNALSGMAIASGRPLRPVPDLTAAQRLLTLDADVLRSVQAAREWFANRQDKRLYAIESAFTLTGTQADHRLPMPSQKIGDFLIALAGELGVLDGLTPPPEPFANPAIPQWVRAIADDLRQFTSRSLVLVGPIQPPWVHALAAAINERLQAPIRYLQPRHTEDRTLNHLVEDIHAGKVKTLLILGGNPVFTAPADLEFSYALAQVPNSIHLSLFYDQTSEACTWRLPMAHPLETWGDTELPDGTLGCIQPLIAPLRQGRSAIEVLTLLLGGKQSSLDWVKQSFAQRAKLALTDAAFTPRFNAYKQLGYLKDSSRLEAPPAVQQDAVRAAVAQRPRLVPSQAETYEVTFHPDYKLHDGRYAWNAWLQELPDPLTKLTWDNAAWISPADALRRGLSTGDVIALSVAGRFLEIPAVVLPGQAEGSIALFCGQFGRMPIRHVPNGGGFNVYTLRDSKNPDIAPLAILEPTGRRYELAITQEHGTIPQGRNLLGEAGHGTLHSSAGKAQGAGPSPGHHSPDHPEAAPAEHQPHPSHSDGHGQGPAIGIAPDGHVTEADLKRGFQGPYGQPRFQGTPGEKQARFPLDLARPEILDSPFQWGMVINLNACTGCSACVIACQAENNIPVVGKTEVLRHREMHWLRIDRYFIDEESASGAGNPEARGAGDTRLSLAAGPRVAHQPVACVHCEQAPCEQVCPVNAAVHSEEGLNLQVYNRCIGTRYCSNACPYKARRFNWFDYNKRGLDELRTPTPFARAGMAFKDSGVPESLVMQKNPDVSLRMRGVMEKCTYCVQRLESAKSAAKVAAAEVAQGRRTIPTVAGYAAPDGSAHKKPIDPQSAGYDLDDHGRVIVPDGFVATACQQACPTGAIVFGNVRDPNGKVYLAKQQADEYLLLGELNTKPRTSYLPRKRNLNPALA